ncbi:mitochondrial chaperone bcs1 [Colletotrichum musicola]|uniref:Mitochondrial chaperone bcs1 n=1 Tax=Colletotrichum musicola TaxID=2175873 RepID=A0A8H6IQM7_9PEZI|nr:mitochondrial chaperone bcs1 [Colletotrichum musicola]
MTSFPPAGDGITNFPAPTHPAHPAHPAHAPQITLRRRVIWPHLSDIVASDQKWSTQEEAMWYRLLLYLSLHKRHYPFRRRLGLCTPDGGHNLLAPGTMNVEMLVVSVLSIAAIRRPEVRKVQVSASGTDEMYEFARAVTTC